MIENKLIKPCKKVTLKFHLTQIICLVNPNCVMWLKPKKKLKREKNA